MTGPAAGHLFRSHNGRPRAGHALTIQAATHLSAQACFVSVELGSDRQGVEVLATIQEFMDSRSVGAVQKSVIFSLDDHEYTIRAQ